MAKKNEATTSSKEAEAQVAYVGPSFGGVIHCTVYLGELPKELQEKKEKCKAFENLIVKIDKYCDAINNLRNKNSVEAICYKKAFEFLKKGGV